jgi:2-isopropylmalate synthase
VIQRLTDATSREISSQEIWDAFDKEYVTQPNGRFDLVSFEASRVPGSNQVVRIKAEVSCDGEVRTIEAEGNGPVNAFSKAMREAFGLKFRLKDYAEHTRSVGSDAEAAAYIELKAPDEQGRSVFGVGIATDITMAPIRAVVSACNRL